jgi:transcriptional regulator with XRE-family HTH domain
MPLSVRRHNLVRVRESLSLTQSEFARLVGRSFSTIKSIEAGSLKLSNQLATLIAEATGADRAWLLRNDPGEPMPPLKIPEALVQPENMAYELYCGLLEHLFDRLFAALSRLPAGKRREWLQRIIKIKLDDEISIGGYKPGGGRPLAPVKPGTLDFFRKHPEFLDPELARWINLQFLVKDAYRIAKAWELPAEHRDQPPTARPQPLEEAPAAFEAAIKNDPRFAQELAEAEAFFAEEAAQPQGRPRSKPAQSPASPAPSDRRSSRRSSANRRGEAR